MMLIKKYKWILGAVFLGIIIFILIPNDKKPIGGLARVEGRIVEIIIDDFSGGVSNNPQDRNLSKVQIIKNFDIKDGRLVPFRDSESGDNQATVRHIQAFTFGNSQLWGYGVAEGDDVAGNAATFRKTAASLDDDTWSNPIASSTVGNRNTDFFIHYKNFLYGAKDNAIWRYGDITGTPTFTESFQSFTFTDIAQGVWHSQDDILYIAHDNIISSWDNTTFIQNALVLPTDKRINAIAEYGPFLAIGTESRQQDVAGVLSSRVYIWDRNSSLTTVHENLDWGTGQLELLGVLDGLLIGVSHSPDLAAGGDNSSFNSKITFRAYDGRQVVKFFELDGDTIYTQFDLEGSMFKYGEALYFPLAISIDGTLQEGIWKIYRSRPDGPLSVVLDRTPNNNSALSNGRIRDVFIWDDFMFIAYQDGGASALSKTNDLPSYTASSTIETVTFGDGIHRNILRSIGVATEPIPSGGQIDISFKMDEGQWVLATTSQVVGAMFTEIVNNVRDGTLFPQFTRARFRVDSLGNATTTGIRLKYEILDSIMD